MFQKIMENKYKKALYILGICFIVLLNLLGSYKVQAQQHSLFNVSFSPPYYCANGFLKPLFGDYFFSGFHMLPPSIRHTAFIGKCYKNIWNSENLRPVIPAPKPVIRRAAATITILITQGPTQALLVYNPTILFGQSAPTIIPTALTLPALLGGNPLIFGSAPITSSNLAVFNYVANNLLLPSGIAFYIIP